MRDLAVPQAPIILVGTGRCGSTMLHRLMASHETLGWLSTFNETFPQQTWLSMFSNLYRAPLRARIKDARAFPKPFEAYRFWERHLPGFTRRDRPQTVADVFEPGIEPVRLATAKVLRYQRRPRLLVKITGWSRIAYFDRVYPDARFVSLRRDPRAVVSSWIKAGWLDVTSPPTGSEWQWGPVPSEYLDVWHDLGGGPSLSVALKIRLDLDDIASNMALFPDRCYELAYEDVISSPAASLRHLCEFAELEWSDGFQRTIANTEFYDSTTTWRRHLSETEGRRIMEFLDRTADLPVRQSPSMHSGDPPAPLVPADDQKFRRA